MKTSAILLLTLFSFSIFAQTISKTISGTVKNTQNEILPGATVKLLKATDSLMLAREITNANGKFQFNNLQNGTYLLAITAMGQKPFTSVALTIDDTRSNIVLPVIVLLPAKNIELKEVVVKAKRPLIEQDIDKTIVNVESMISSATSNTLEVLEKTPGVTVGSNGEISLNGRSGILVLIDCRATYMSGPDLAAYLKSLPGGLLDKIELMDNPSAKYDAAGNGIINIRLKKNRVGGFTGNSSMGSSQGVYGRHNGSLNMNYNHKKLNVFANLGANKEKNYNNDVFDRLFYDTRGQQTSNVLLLNDNISDNKSLNAILELDFAATPKTTYGLMLNLNGGTRNAIIDYQSNNYNTNRLLDAIGNGNTVLNDKRTNFGTNLNLQHKFNKPGQEMMVDMNYLNYQSNGNQRVQNFRYLPEGALAEQDEFLYLVPGTINIYTAKADYVHPLKKKTSWEAGVKSSVIDNDNISNYFNVKGTVQTIDNGKSNHFKYHENINAAYFNTRKEWKRVGIQLGLRAETTQARGNQLGNEVVQGSTFTKNYTKVFPSLFINYKLDSLNKNSLNLSFTRRINRPDYQSLNPFVFFRDQYSYTAGNPLLFPQYQNRIELKFQHKQWLQMGLSYNRFTNVIFQTTEAIDTIFITRPNNVASGFMLLLNTTLSASPTKWWNLIYTIRLSHMGLNGMSYTEKLNPRAYVARFEVYNQFRLNKGWSADLSGYYASSDLNGQAYTDMMYRVGGAVQKKIWKDKASLRISVDDVFHSWIRHNRSVSIKQAQFFQTNESDTQRIGVAFTYRFGKDTFARKRRHNDNAADDEKGRVN
ncbi:outer membrane beta-barrel protein [Runella sp.]|uniref:outer membrane beta-barrel protein n=1 Tax=Runella sp. TaxID=1960881 RepID=UPI00261798C2|nr:outer membrane beta-barrel protein [Runella sp.]